MTDVAPPRPAADDMIPWESPVVAEIEVAAPAALTTHAVATGPAVDPAVDPVAELDDRVEALVNSGDVVAAYGLVRAAAEDARVPKHVHNLGVLRAMAGDPHGAVTLLDAAGLLDPDNEEIRVNRRAMLPLTIGSHRPPLPFNPELFLRKLEIVDRAEPQRHASYKLPERRYPWSVTAEEGLILYELVATMGLRSGFEIATAFGVSTMYLGNAFRQTGGHLVSMDAYIEESFDDFLYGDINAEFDAVKERIARGQLPLGLAYAAQMVQLYGLGDVVDLSVGLSPRDIACPAGHFDFAFIDGGHFGDQPSLDTLAALSYMNVRPCVIAFHDNNDNASVAAAIELAARRLDVAPINFGTKYSLSAIIVPG